MSMACQDAFGADMYRQREGACMLVRCIFEANDVTVHVCRSQTLFEAVTDRWLTFVGFNLLIGRPMKRQGKNPPQIRPLGQELAPECPLSSTDIRVRHLVKGDTRGFYFRSFSLSPSPQQRISPTISDPKPVQRTVSSQYTSYLL